MRILLLNQTFYPELLATSQQVADLALFLKNAGHEVTVFTGRRGYENRKKIFLKSEIWNGIHIERVHSTGFGKTSIIRRVIDSLTFDLMLFSKLVLSPRFDRVVSFTSPPLLGVLGSLFCVIKGGRSIQWLMDINPDAAFSVGYVNREGIIGRFLTKVFEWTLHKSDDIVVLDRWMKKTIVSHGVPPEKISIIPPWSVFNHEDTSFKTGVFRKQNALENKFVILYSGNHSVVHPLDTVLQSALKLKNNKDIQFVFAGSGLRTEDVKKYKEEHQLENITQVPWQSREAVRDLFSSVDLHLVVMGPRMSGLVHPSKIYSVLASGKPYLFVGPQGSYVVDLLRECPGGKHLEHEDIEGFVREVLWFKALKEEQKRAMGEGNKEYLAKKFSAEESKGKFEKEVISKQRYSIKIGVGGRFHSDRLINSLRERGWRASLFTSLPKSRFKTVAPSLIRSSIFPEIISRLGAKLGMGQGNDFKMCYFGGRFAAACKQEKELDVILSWSSFGLEAFKQNQKKVKVLVRDSTHILNQVGILQKEYDEFKIPFPDHKVVIQRELEEYQLADKIIVLSELAKRSFLNRGIEESKLAIIRLGADLSVFKSAEKRRSSSKPLRVVYFGTVGVRKGVRYLFEAFKNLPSNEVTLTCIGPIEHELKSFVQKFSNIEFLPPAPHAKLAGMLKKYDVFVTPSLEDGFGLVVPQAMAAGLVPIVSTSVGASELVRDGETGILVEPKDSDAISNAVLRFLREPGLLEIIRNNIETSKAEISWDSYGDSFDTVLRDTVKKFSKESKSPSSFRPLEALHPMPS